MTHRILVLGGTGMVGHKMFEILSKREDLDVWATCRNQADLPAAFPAHLVRKMRPHVDADNFDTVIRALASLQPDVVINCIGLIKQLSGAQDPLTSITVNSQLPHRISLVCRTAGARLIHLGTDCVFDGSKGSYREDDPSDAKDLYGRTKYLGEVYYEPHCVTLRTSIIGHEIKGMLSLVEWFMAQRGTVKGYTKAIYSGLTTVELARVVADYVLPNPHLTGLYHLSVDPVSKHDLLGHIAKTYGKKIAIIADDTVAIDRSLDSTRFRQATGYAPDDWTGLVRDMYNDYLSCPYYRTYDDIEQRKGSVKR